VSFERQPCGVSRFASQTEPRELTNRKPRQRVTAIVHDQRTPTSSLPDMGGFLSANGPQVMNHVRGVAVRWKDRIEDLGDSRSICDKSQTPVQRHPICLECRQSKD